MRNTLNPCGCDSGGGGVDITTDNVRLAGSELTCIGAQPDEVLTSVIGKIDQAICGINDNFDNYYTKSEIDAILGDYAQKSELIVSGDVVGNNLNFRDEANTILFTVDATEFNSQGTILNYDPNTGELQLINPQSQVLSTANLTPSGTDTISIQGNDFNYRSVLGNPGGDLQPGDIAYMGWIDQTTFGKILSFSGTPGTGLNDSTFADWDIIEQI